MNKNVVTAKIWSRLATYTIENHYFNKEEQSLHKEWPQYTTNHGEQKPGFLANFHPL